ncbi:MAG: type II secretion system F family protein [Thermoguttaceae bacterium]
MVSYRYLAENAAGERVDGHADARSVEDARRQLEERGLKVLEVIQADSGWTGPAPQQRLTRDEAQELVENVAQLSAAELPLAPAFRAAAEETDSPRLSRVFSHLATQLERGQSLEQALESSGPALPAHVTRMIQAAIRTGQLGPALTELVEHYRDASALRQMIWDGLAYPLLVATLAVVLLGLIFAYVVGGFEKIYGEFGCELPTMTVALLGLRQISGLLLPAVLLALVLFMLLLRGRLGRGRWHRFISALPVIGPLWHWLCLVEWMGLVRVLLRNGMTLLDALRCSADGVGNANITEISLSLADGIARGRTLSQAMASERQVPAALTPLIYWGERTGALGDSLELGCEMLEDRVRMRAFWLHAALPPILFISIGAAVLALITAMFLPLINLLTSLT